jgi:OOP family OmpA-OmpF porin
MSRIPSTIAATTAVALVAFAAAMVPAFAAGQYDGIWVIDVPADRMSGAGADPACPPLRLWVQVVDNQVSGNFRRSYPEAHNVIENGGTNNASQVTGNVQADGTVTAQWQNYHARGQLSGDTAAVTMQTSCGPLQAYGQRLDESTTEIASTSWGWTGIQMAAASSGSSEAPTVASAPATRHDAYNVYFAFDKSKLTLKGHGVVDAAVKATRGDPTSRITLVGKADRSGTDPYNMALSERRADRVRDAMVAEGVPADRIDTQWVGEREPPVPTANGVRDAQNRVVEVAIR